VADEFREIVQRFFACLGEIPRAFSRGTSASLSVPDAFVDGGESFIRLLRRGWD
jgi:hypothetical protein